MRIEVEPGVALEVDVRGVGPHLLCVHGFGGAKEDFADHVELLAERATVVIFDLLGHGGSDGPEEPAAYSLDRLARDVIAVADVLGAERFRLLGHSMGGMVVRRVAVAVPERVDAVVFMSTAARAPEGLDPALVDVAAQLALDDFGALKAVLDEVRVLGTPAYERLLVERPGFREFGEWKWSRVRPAMWAALAPEVVREPDALAEVRRITCPVLVMIGELDRAFYEGSTELAAAAPDARLVVVPDAGHHPQFENPEAWQKAVLTFLAELS